MDPPSIPKNVSEHQTLAENPNEELKSFSDEIDVIKSGCWIS